MEGNSVMASGIVEQVVRLALRQRTLVGQQLYVRAVVNEATLLTVQLEVLASQVGKAPAWKRVMEARQRIAWFLKPLETTLSGSTRTHIAMLVATIACLTSRL